VTTLRQYPQTPFRARRVAGALIAAALFAIPHSASAQGTAATAPLQTGQWTVTPVIGTAFSGDVDSPTVVLGVAGGYNWSPKISFEGEFNVLPSSEQSGVVELDTRVWNITGNMLYRFSGTSSFVPYGAIGLGLGHGSASVNNTGDPLLNSVSTSSNALVVNFGGGVERSITDVIKVRGDLRYFFGGDLVADYWRFGIGVSFNVGGHQ
jgi:opacity protein-like surface antigen